MILHRRGEFCGSTLRFEDPQGFGRVVQPGDTVVYVVRGGVLDRDRLERATFRDPWGETALLVSRGEERFLVRRGDVFDVEPAQHGWTGAPASSGAW